MVIIDFESLTIPSIIGFFSQDKFVYDKRKNRLSLAALNLLYTLIEHGYCMDSKVAKKVVDEMCSLLEGNTFCR